jgi:hypothetical protein
MSSMILSMEDSMKTDFSTNDPLPILACLLWGMKGMGFQSIDIIQILTYEMIENV